MKDRVPKYPGRVKLIPVDGEANTFDMVRADEPVEEGTALNKKNLLTDTTAALFGLDATAVPNEVLALLSRAVLVGSEPGSLNDVMGAAAGKRFAVGSYAGTGLSGSENAIELTFDFSPQLVVITQDGGSKSGGLGNVMIRGQTRSAGFGNYNNTNDGVMITWGERSVSWYAGTSSSMENFADSNYFYFAFGV